MSSFAIAIGIGVGFSTMPIGGGTPPEASFLLLETGDFLLLESGDKLIL